MDLTNFNKCPEDAGLQPLYQEAKKLIAKYSTILIFIQKNNDSDAIGSALALATAIQNKHKEKRIYVIGWRPLRYGVKLPEEFQMPEGHILNENDTLGITVDILKRRQIPSYNLVNYCTEFIVFDHHDDQCIESDWRQRKVLTICNDYFRSCCGLILDFINPGNDGWHIPMDALILLTKGHYIDTSSAENSLGIGDTYSRLTKLNMDVAGILRDSTRCSGEMMQATCKLITEGEKDGKAVLVTFNKNQVFGREGIPDVMFTFPVKFLYNHLKAKTVVYFHYCLKESIGTASKRNIFIAPVKHNPDLDELLLSNGYQKNKSGFFKNCDIMEFRDLYKANGSLFAG